MWQNLLTTLIGYDADKEPLQPVEQPKRNTNRQRTTTEPLPDNVAVNTITDKLEVHTEEADGTQSWADFNPDKDLPLRGSLTLTEAERTLIEQDNRFSAQTATLMKPLWAKRYGPKQASTLLSKKYPRKRGLSYESCSKYWRLIFNKANPSPTADLARAEEE